MKPPATVWVGFNEDGSRSGCEAEDECKLCERDGVKRFRYRLDTPKPRKAKKRGKRD